MYQLNFEYLDSNYTETKNGLNKWNKMSKRDYLVSNKLEVISDASQN